MGISYDENGYPNGIGRPLTNTELHEMGCAISADRGLRIDLIASIIKGVADQLYLLTKDEYESKCKEAAEKILDAVRR